MAGDWIKMRTALADDPAVIAMAEELDLDEFSIVGRLHHLWSWADTQSRDGHAKGVTKKWVDRYVRCDGFAQALVMVGWLEQDDDGIRFPHFDRHNGESAKARGLATIRKQKQRSNVTNELCEPSRNHRDSSVTREEKRREDIKPSNANALLVDSDADDALPTLDLTSQDSKDAAEPHAGHSACPHQQIIALYHAILPSNPAIRDWTPARQATLRVRWNEDRRRQNLDWWRGFFEYVSHSRFLTGRASQHDRKPFTPGLEWLLKAENFAKIREGRYEDEEVTA